MASSLLPELKRRHVYRVGVGYAAFAFVILQGADIVLPALGVSDRTFQLLVVVVLAGFPVALVLAWLFDITPEGVRRTGASPSDAPQAAGPWILIWTATLVLSAGALAGTGWWFLRGAGEPGDPAAEADSKSLVVIPFVNRSGDPQEEYFSDGLADAVITALTRVRGLRVASRTSSFALKGSPLTAGEIAASLGVASILEGSRGARDSGRNGLRQVPVG